MTARRLVWGVGTFLVVSFALVILLSFAGWIGPVEMLMIWAISAVAAVAVTRKA